MANELPVDLRAWLRSSDCEVVEAFAAIGGSGYPISPGTILCLAYSDATGALKFTGESDFDVSASSVVDIQIDGGIVNTGGGFIGGGFGLVGIAVGMLTAAGLNALTQQSDIQTFLRIATLEGEIILFTSTSTPDALRLKLSPLYSGIRKWSYLGEAAKSDEKDCPLCAERIKRAAILCRFCGKDLPVEESQE